MDRDRIDWENLGPLPRKVKAVGADRDDLAARKFNMGKAKHKGRCHITNQKRRQIAKEAREEMAVTLESRKERFKSLKDKIRAYWRGERETHP